MLLVIKYSVYANSGLFTCDEEKIFHASRHNSSFIFCASFIAFMTSYVISLASFCQEGSESSAITCQIVWINTIILFVCYLFKIRMRFKRRRKMHQMSYKPGFMQNKYLIWANQRLARDWWCSWMWGQPPLIP